MKRKFISMILVVAMFATLFSGCGKKDASSTDTSTTDTASNDTASNGADTSGKTEGEQKYPEFITVDVFDSMANYQGIQSGWYAKIIKDKFNMELNIIAPSVAGGGDTLYQTRTAAGNLGDLIIHNASGGILEDLVNAGLVADMTDLMKDSKYLNTYKDAIDFTNQSNATTEGTWCIPSEVTVNPATQRFGGTTLNGGAFIRWDLYKQLGYPEVNTLEDLLPLMKNMQDLGIKSDSGKDTYAFSFFKDWDGDVMNIALSFCQNYGMANMGFLWPMADDSKPAESTIDSNSTYVRALKFLFDANQMGLVDPESTSQNYDTLYNKYNDGQILWAPWLWIASGYNTDEHKADGKMYQAVEVKDYKNYAWGCYAKGNPQGVMMIGSGAKDKQRLVDFLDWLHSPEGIAVSDNVAIPGIEDLQWEMKDGKPELTDFGYQCAQDPNNTQMPAEYGGGTYYDGMCKLGVKIVSDGETNPETNFPYNYTLWDSYTQKNVSDVQKDWQEHYGALNSADYFEKQGEIVVSAGSGYSSPADSSEIATIRNQIKEVIKEFSWKAVFAKDEDEFNSMIKQMQDTAIGLGYNDVIAVDQQNVDAQKQARIDVSK